ncbi:MAG: 2-C-methyl-D-erythritol 2,4-cyclodiphosphate synthase, partial [Clostridia bacterium]|nr:2-C-methyl-D-erythritol 2,4-cyclodiphosphate synthase [Clostridia bacterium]
FPDTDPAYKNADSMKLLDKVILLIKEKGYKVKSLSAVIMAEKPKLLKQLLRL